MEIAPAEFWKLTPAELSDMLAGAQEREERVWQRTAWHVAHELNIAGKVMNRHVTAAQLLGKHEGPKDPAADFEALWGRIQERGIEEVN